MQQRYTAVARALTLTVAAWTVGTVLGLYAVPCIASIPGPEVLAYASEDNCSDVEEVLKGVSVEPAEKYDTECYKRLEAALGSLSTRLDIEDLRLRKGDVQRAYRAVTKDNPRMFYLDGLTVTTASDTDLVETIEPRYIRRTDKVKKMRNRYEAKVKEALRSTKGAVTDEEKARALHDWLCFNTEYDHAAAAAPSSAPALESESYGAMVSGKALCLGYSRAYQDLLSRVGIRSSIAESETMGHGWNIVRVEGSWRHVDATFDDTSTSAGAPLSHRYFLKTDSEMAALEYRGWTAGHRCS